MQQIYYPRRFGGLQEQHWLCECIRVPYETNQGCNILMLNMDNQMRVTIELFRNYFHVTDQIKDRYFNEIQFALQIEPWSYAVTSVEHVIRIFSQLRLNAIHNSLVLDENAKDELPNGWRILHYLHENDEFTFLFGKRVAEYECSFTLKDGAIHSWQMNVSGDKNHKDPSIMWPVAHDMLLAMLTFANLYRKAPNRDIFLSMTTEDLQLLYQNTPWFDLTSCPTVSNSVLSLYPDIEHSARHYFDAMYHILLTDKKSNNTEEVLWIN